MNLKIEKFIFMKINFTLQKTPFKRMKRKLRIGRIYLQNTCPVKKHIQKIQRNQLKMGKKPKQTTYQRKYTDDK